MKLVQKLTARAMGWDRNRIGTMTTDSKEPNGRVHLGRIVGIVTSLKQTVNNDTGEIQTGLKGNFRGISALTDENGSITVTSGVCYLPAGIQSMLEGELAAAQANDKTAVINFAIDLNAFRDTNKAGYSFDADNVVEGTVADPLSDLLEKAAAVKALPGGDAKPAIEDKSGEEKPADGKTKK